MRAEEILSSEEFKRCAEFHGHVCPGLSIGFKAAQALMARLGVTRSPDEELVAIVETDACGVDAIQVLTGCTFGKGNLIFKNYGKNAFSLFDRNRGKVFRACLRSDAMAIDPSHLTLFKKVRQGHATAEDMEKFQELHEKRLKDILETDPNILFTIKEIDTNVPPQARVVESVACDMCGEPTMADLLQNIEGQRVCIPCSERALK
jgi:formylmethanofuran dehydrogenase subunit E